MKNLDTVRSSIDRILPSDKSIFPSRVSRQEGSLKLEFIFEHDAYKTLQKGTAIWNPRLRRFYCFHSQDQCLKGRMMDQKTFQSMIKECIEDPNYFQKMV